LQGRLSSSHCDHNAQSRSKHRPTSVLADGRSLLRAPTWGCDVRLSLRLAAIVRGDRSPPCSGSRRLLCARRSPAAQDRGACPNCKVAASDLLGSVASSGRAVVFYSLGLSEGRINRCINVLCDSTGRHDFVAHNERRWGHGLRFSNMARRTRGPTRSRRPTTCNFGDGVGSRDISTRNITTVSFNEDVSPSVAWGANSGMIIVLHINTMVWSGEVDFSSAPGRTR
jgi:hypothetical protein